MYFLSHSINNSASKLFSTAIEDCDLFLSLMLTLSELLFMTLPLAIFLATDRVDKSLVLRVSLMVFWALSGDSGDFAGSSMSKKKWVTSERSAS